MGWRDRIVEDWKTWPRRWSVQLNAAGSALLAWLVASPDAAFAAWHALPDDLRAVIPSRMMPLIALALFALSAFAQLVKQQKLKPPPTEPPNDASTGP